MRRRFPAQISSRRWVLLTTCMLVVVIIFVSNFFSSESRGVKVVLAAPLPSPTPGAAAPAPSPTVFTPSLSRVSLEGPQFPEDLEVSHFLMYYIVRGNWPIVLRYELEDGALARLTITPSERGSFISKEAPATGIGKLGKVSLQVPENYGEPQVVELRISATYLDSQKEGSPELVVHSLGCGGGAFVNGSGVRRAGRTANNHVERPIMSSNIQEVSSDEVAIQGITLTPSPVFDTSSNNPLSFVFKSTNDFSLWSATFRRQHRSGGRTRWIAERTFSFTEPIIRGSTKTSSWDGKNNSGSVVRGRYYLMINAWTSASVDGSALTSFSSPAIEVR